MADPSPGTDTRLDELIYEAVRGRSGRAGADIPTILESVDSRERWVLTFDELDGGLRRLSERGLIREVAIGRYAASVIAEDVRLELRKSNTPRRVVLRFHDGDKVLTTGDATGA